MDLVRGALHPFRNLNCPSKTFPTICRCCE